MHGLDCLVELLGFEISLIKSGGEGVHTDLNVFGLDLLAATLTAGKSGNILLQVLLPRTGHKPEQHVISCTQKLRMYSSFPWLDLSAATLTAGKSGNILPQVRRPRTGHKPEQHVVSCTQKLRMYSSFPWPEQHVVSCTQKLRM